MDYEILVDDRIQDGQSLIVELVRDGFDVSVAFWAKTSEEGPWYLYLGSASVSSMGLADAYRTVYAVLSRVPSTSISPSEIKLIDATSPIAVNAIALRGRFHPRSPTRFRGKKLGNLSIEEAYIYPATGPMSRDEIVQTVANLINKDPNISRAGAVPAPSLITLRDGTQIRAVPVGIQSNTRRPGGFLQIELYDPAAGTNQSILADDVVSILPS